MSLKNRNETKHKVTEAQYRSQDEVSKNNSFFYYKCIEETERQQNCSDFNKLSFIKMLFLFAYINSHFDNTVVKKHMNKGSDNGESFIKLFFDNFLKKYQLFLLSLE